MAQKIIPKFLKERTNQSQPVLVERSQSSPVDTAIIRERTNIATPLRPDRFENTRWDLSDIEKYFDAVTLPPGPVKLSKCELVREPPKFVETHLMTVRANNGNRTFLPFLNRLQKFMSQETFENNKILQNGT